MNRIITHWTAGSYHPNYVDFEHYHFLITGEGLRVIGNYEPEDNLDCKDGKYAAGAEGGNTGTIHIALCGMYGYKSSKDFGEFPINQKQFEEMCLLTAELCIKYGIKITPKTVLTHYEFDKNRGKEGRKIDITCLPFLPDMAKNEIGKYIRNKVNWYKLKIEEKI